MVNVFSLRKVYTYGTIVLNTIAIRFPKINSNSTERKTNVKRRRVY